MKYIKLFILLISVLLVACADEYDQRYDTFNDFDKARLRNKSWFPSFISNDTYNIKNRHSLDEPLFSFGTFSYSNNYYYDSIFNKEPSNKIDFSEFSQKLKQHLKHRPYWFLTIDNISPIDYETIKEDRFFIVRHRIDKKIYFILSN